MPLHYSETLVKLTNDCQFPGWELF
uniref:Uncharacterized protein n=1 Tax=Anguilla anguilla TaxID=7936 RepID=A0A0E9R196_ANGAN